MLWIRLKLKWGSAATRRQAVLEVNRSVNPEASHVLIEVLSNDRDSYVRMAAIEGVAERRDAGAISILATTARPNGNSIVEEAAIAALGKIGGGDARRELLSLLRAKGVRTRATAARSLGLVAGPGVLEALTWALMDDDVDDHSYLHVVSRAAIEALERSAPGLWTSPPVIAGMVGELLRRIEKYSGQETSKGTPDRYRDEVARHKLEHAVALLHWLAEHHVGKVEEPQLRRMAALPPPFVIEHDYYGDYDGHSMGQRFIGDTETLNRLCREEIRRRGLAE
jgi:hypothetical protein